MAKETTQQGLEVYQKQVSDIEAFAQSVVIKDDNDLQRVSDYIKQSKEAQKVVEDKKEEYTSPAKQIIETAKATYDPLIKAFKSVETTLKDKASRFILDRNAKIKEKEEKLARDAEDGKISEKTALKKMEKLPEQVKTVQGGASQLRVTEYEDIEITDQKLIPNEYMVPDMVKLKAVVLKGRIEVPGVRIIKKTKTSSY